MDKWQTTLRVEQIRREIAQIQGADRIYKRHIAHTVEQNAEHEKRQQRLQEILAELDSLAPRSAT
jgi:DNA-binding FrmR family transcriptional regulator